MPYTAPSDTDKQAAWQAYITPMLAQWNASNVGGDPNFKNTVANLTSFERNQFENKWANDQTVAQNKANAQDATDAANGNATQAYGLANADLTRTGSNATDDAIKTALMAKINGQVLDPNDVPYDATTINALMVGQGQTAAAAETARNQQLMDSVASNGGSSYDPGVRAALQQSLTQRQNQVSDSQLSINQQANVANQQARTQAQTTNNNAQLAASSALQGENNSQQARQTQASQNYQNLLEQQKFSTTGGAKAAPTATALNGQPPAATTAPNGQPPAATTGFGAYTTAINKLKPTATAFTRGVAY